MTPKGIERLDRLRDRAAYLARWIADACVRGEDRDARTNLRRAELSALRWAIGELDRLCSLEPALAQHVADMDDAVAIATFGDGDIESAIACAGASTDAVRKLLGGDA